MKRLLSILCCLVLAASAVQAADAIFDVSHGQYQPMTSSDRFDTARTLLTSAGHTLSELNGPVTLAALAPYDIYVSGTLDMGYTASEVQALQDYVGQGGTVIIIHDGGYNSNSATASVNDFLAPYGMAMATSSTYPGGVLVEGFVSHCLTENVNTVGLDYIRELTSIGGAAVDLTLGGPEFLAVWEGAGTVVVCGDDSGFSDDGEGADYTISSYDNTSLLLNLFDCAGGTVATEAASWSAVKSMFD